MSIALKQGEKQLNLTPDQEITVVVENPLFAEEITTKEYSYPFILPLDQNNRSFIEHQNRVDNYTAPFFEGIDLIIDGETYAQAMNMYVNSGNEFYVEAEVKEEQVVFDVLETKLNTIAPVIEIPGHVAYVRYQLLAMFSRSKKIKKQRLILLLNNWVYVEDFRGVGSNFVTAVNNIAAKINVDFPGSTTVVFDNGVYYLEIEHLDTYIFNITVIENFAIMDETREDIVVDQATIATFIKGLQLAEDNRVAFPMVKMDNAYDGRNPEWKNYVNVLYHDTFPVNVDSEIQGWAHTYIAMPRLNYILSILEVMMGLEFEGEFIEDLDTADLVIFNNHTLDNYKTIVGQTGRNDYNPIINLNMNLPNIKCKDLLNVLVRDFGLYVIPQADSLRFYYKNEQLLSDPVDWTNRTSSARIIYDHSKGINIEYKEIEGDILQHLLPTYKEDKGERDEPLGFSTLPKMTTLYDEDTDTLELCASGVTVTPGPSSMPLSFIYDRGLRTSTLGLLYPKSSNDQFHFDVQIGNKDLLLNGKFLDFNLLERITLTTSDTITISVDLNIFDILSLKFDWLNAKRIITTKHDGSAVYIIKKIEFTARVNASISSSKVTLVRYE